MDGSSAPLVTAVTAEARSLRRERLGFKPEGKGLPTSKGFIRGDYYSGDDLSDHDETATTTSISQTATSSEASVEFEDPTIGGVRVYGLEEEQKAQKAMSTSLYHYLAGTDPDESSIDGNSRVAPSLFSVNQELEESSIDGSNRRTQDGKFELEEWSHDGTTSTATTYNRRATPESVPESSCYTPETLTVSSNDQRTGHDSLDDMDSFTEESCYLEDEDMSNSSEEELDAVSRLTGFREHEEMKQRTVFPKRLISDESIVRQGSTKDSISSINVTGTMLRTASRDDPKGNYTFLSTKNAEQNDNCSCSVITVTNSDDSCSGTSIRDETQDVHSCVSFTCQTCHKPKPQFVQTKRKMIARPLAGTKWWQNNNTNFEEQMQTFWEYIQPDGETMSCCQMEDGSMEPTFVSSKTL